MLKPIVKEIIQEIGHELTCDGPGCNKTIEAVRNGEYIRRQGFSWYHVTVKDNDGLFPNKELESEGADLCCLDCLEKFLSDVFRIKGNVNPIGVSRFENMEVLIQTVYHKD